MYDSSRVRYVTGVREGGQGARRKKHIGEQGGPVATSLHLCTVTSASSTYDTSQ